MSEASFASLNPTLLARKGGAKPAMRPQLAPLPVDSVSVGEDALEDLGWNDMGCEEPGVLGGDQKSAAVIAISPRAANEDLIEVQNPIVRRQQRDIVDRVLANAAMPGSPEAERQKSETARKSSTKSHAKRAAFTLRLDPERHLKLRLAATIRNASAQALVTEALDAMLGQFDDLDALAERMRQR